MLFGDIDDRGDTGGGGVSDVIEDFEGDAPLTNYRSVDGGWAVRSAASAEGSYGLRYSADSNASSMASATGLGAYPQPGTTWSYWQRNGESNPENNSTYHIGCLFAVNDHTDPGNSERYFALFLPGSGDLLLQKRTGNSDETQNIARGTVYSDYSPDEWVRIEITWPFDPRTDPFEMELFTADGTSQGSISTTDDRPYTFDNFGWHSSTIGASLSSPYHDIDHAVVTSGTGKATGEERLVLESHEYKSFPYTGPAVNHYTITDDQALEGNRLFQHDGDEFERVAHETAVTERGNRYSALVTLDTRVWFLVGAQSRSSPFDNCYAVALEADTNTIAINRRSTSSSNAQIASDTAELTDGERYEVSFDYGATDAAGNLTATVSQDGTTLGSVTATDNEHTGGTFGFYSSQGTTGDQWDYITETILDETVLEDHETGAFNYTGPHTGNYTVANDTALEGSYLLQSDGSEWRRVAHETAHTQRGRKYRARCIVNERAWFLIGVQSRSSPFDNCYAIAAEPDTNTIDVLKRSTSTGNSKMGTADVTLSEGTEYWVELDWGSIDNANNLIGRIYDAGGAELASVIVEDNEHTGGTFGFYSATGADGDKWDYITELRR